MLLDWKLLVQQQEGAVMCRSSYDETLDYNIVYNFNDDFRYRAGGVGR